MKKKQTTPRDPDYFIIGLQKSGSYWLTALLDAHPEIRCLPTHYMHNIMKGTTGADEGRIFDMLASIDKDGGEALTKSFTDHHGGFFASLIPLIGKANKEQLYDAVKIRYKEWFAFHNPDKKPIVGDKTTEYVFHLDVLDTFFPNAKKICIMRDPKDRVVSWHFHQIRRGRKKTRKISDMFIREYIENQIKKEYECLRAYSGHIHCLTYEQLTENPDKTIAALLTFLNARSSPDIIRTMIKQASIEKLRKEDKVYTGGATKRKGQNVIKSHYRKGIVGDWKNNLTAKQAAYIDRELGTMQTHILKKYGVGN